jgi:hypothetical protein
VLVKIPPSLLITLLRPTVVFLYLVVLVNEHVKGMTFTWK